MRTFQPNPMKARSEPVNLTAGDDPGKKHTRSVSKGAGKQMGPSIAPGYLVTGTGKTGATGGPFAKANTAKKTKSSKSRKSK